VKVPLVYPKIPDTTNCPLKQCIVFSKIDGTNLSWYCKPKLGWYAFGTRRDKFDLNKDGIAKFNLAHPGLEDATKIFKQAYINAVDYKNINHEVVLFTEFYGYNSFAGQHDPKDKKKLVLFDVSMNGNLFMPEEFLEAFGQYDFGYGYDTPEVLYKGKYSGQLVEDIRKDKYNTKEGAVIKGVVDGRVYMCKQKTDAYIQRLKTEFKDNWEQYI
jgi:hypothetical protein